MAKKAGFNFYWILVILAVLFIIFYLEIPGGPKNWELHQLKKNIEANKVVKVTFEQSGEITGIF